MCNLQKPKSVLFRPGVKFNVKFYKYRKTLRAYERDDFVEWLLDLNCIYAALCS